LIRLRCGSRRGTLLLTRLLTALSATDLFGIGDILPLFGASLSDRLRMLGGPAIGKQRTQVRGVALQVLWMILLRVGKLLEHILQVVLDDQVVSMRTAHNTQQLHAPWRRRRMTEE
jgi:hypothetical protein